MRTSIAALLVFVLLGAARAQSLLYSVHGNHAYNLVGSAFATLGDLDADGFDDFVVGISYGANSQRAVVYSGRTLQTLLNLQGGSGSARFGSSVADAGDVNDDGVTDIIVGDPYWNDQKGRAKVYSGKDGSLLYTLPGENGALGLAVTGAGDVNGDGFADFAIGAPYYFDSLLGELGLVLVPSGKDSSLLFRFLGPVTYGFFGQALNTARDVNADGAPDLIIGAPYGGPVFGAGEAEVRSGHDGSVLFSFAGNASDNFGTAVAGAGDIDHDGFDDLLVGAPQFYNPGYVTVQSGFDGHLIFDLRDQANSGSRFGWSVSARDADGDGTPDLLVGAPNERHGSVNSGVAHLFSGATHAELLGVAGNSEVTSVGTAVGFADVDSGGIPELLVGAPSADAPANASGLILAVSHDTPLAYWSNYGAGWSGRYGVPALRGADPAICTRIDAFVGNSSAASTVAVLFFGLAQADLPTAWDGHLRLLPVSAAPFVLPFTGAYLAIDVPCDVTLIGLPIFLQALQLDAWASKGVSFTPGLELVLGGAPLPG